VSSGKNLALANKETIVMAGRLILPLAAEQGVNILPVDSEHSAVFYLLRNRPRPELEEVILTASGGAFRDFPLEALANVSVRDALRHPNWSMGPKITIDSATMANKALEVIEAGRLFDLTPDRIKVVIHPQSSVHSLIRTVDGSLFAQISKPDMRIPIQNALCYPELSPVGFGRLELENVTLEFLPVDYNRFPLLALGYEAARQDGPLPIVFNAANEVAVAAFIQGEITFDKIARLVETCLAAAWPNLHDNLDDVIFIDAQARALARQSITSMR
jgi:1-deoxy-D-xylulose-5-phosphate reductoisomerase